MPRVASGCLRSHPLNPVASFLAVSDEGAWRRLRQEGVCLRRLWGGGVGTHPEFTEKAAGVGGLNLDPPQTAVVLGVGEKLRVRVPSKEVGGVETGSGNRFQGFKSTYRRRGAFNLSAVLQAVAGTIRT